MSNQAERGSEQHERIVRHIAGTIESTGFSEVRANLTDSTERPGSICWERAGSGQVPDITAVKDGRKHIFDVETARSIGTRRTAERLKLFATYADRNRCTFSVVVPTPCRKEAVRRLNECGVFAGVIDVPALGSSD